MLASIKEFNLLGYFATILQYESKKTEFIPLLSFVSDKKRPDDWVQEEDERAKKFQAATMLGGHAFTKDGGQKCTYIPLKVFTNEKKYKNCSREIKGSVCNLNFFNSTMHDEYETCYIIQNPFVNSRKKHNNRVKNQSSSDFYASSEVLSTEPSSEHPKVAVMEWTADDYAKLQREIYASIKCSYKKILIIWCPASEIESELVRSWLKKYKSRTYDRWILKDKPWTQNTWRGVVSFYPDVATAEKATEEISQEHQ